MRNERVKWAINEADRRITAMVDGIEVTVDLRDGKCQPWLVWRGRQWECEPVVAASEAQRIVVAAARALARGSRRG